MAIKSINELTAMTTADLTANQVLVVGDPDDATNPVKKIPAQAAFSGGSSTPDIVVTCTCTDDPASGSGTFSELTFVFGDTIPNLATKLANATLSFAGNCKWPGGVGDVYSLLTLYGVGIIPQATLAQMGITSSTDGLIFDIKVADQRWDNYAAYTSNGQIVVVAAS